MPWLAQVRDDTQIDLTVADSKTGAALGLLGIPVHQISRNPARRCGIDGARDACATKLTYHDPPGAPRSSSTASGVSDGAAPSPPRGSRPGAAGDSAATPQATERSTTACSSSATAPRAARAAAEAEHSAATPARRASTYNQK